MRTSFAACVLRPTLLVLFVGAPFLGMAGCGSSSPGGSNTDGAADGADAHGSGGAAGTGGKTGTGGSIGTGGSSGTGGAGGTGGAIGTGGAGTGGKGGSGGNGTGGADAGVDRPDVADAADVPLDVPADRPVDVSPPDATDAARDVPADVAPRCVAGAACSVRGGAPGFCRNNACVACVDTTDDASCVTAYGAMHVCVRGRCVVGTCHSSAGCGDGLLCGVRTANTCGTCATDGQCRGDARYGGAFICNTTAGQPNSGHCVAAMCTGTGACGANAADRCCNSTCVAGNCCVDDDCRNNPMFGQGFACGANHNCSRCDGVTGNQYLVDPAGGNDDTATGSGRAGNAATASCSFRTVTRALQIIGNNPPVGTTITIVGKAGATTSLQAVAGTGGTPRAEDFPITLGANIKVTTSLGPIALALPAGADGFKLAGNGASLAPVTAAPLTIDGGSSLSGSGIVSAPGAAGTVAISNVTIQNTGDDGISVTDGALNIGAGVVVKGAGLPSDAGRRSGLNISGGTARITVPTGMAQSSFNSNTENGIRVTDLGTLVVTGVAAGEGTVVARSNTLANIFVGHSPGKAPAVTIIDGVLAAGSLNGEGGIQIVGGSRVRLRNSIVLGNGGAGVAITSADDTAAGNALGGIDLGTPDAAGHNVLQAALGSNANTGAGLCVDLAANAGAQTLAAAGNTFAGPRDCATATPGAVSKGTACAARVDQAVVPATGTTVTVNLANCQ